MQQPFYLCMGKIVSCTADVFIVIVIGKVLKEEYKWKNGWYMPKKLILMD